MSSGSKRSGAVLLALLAGTACGTGTDTPHVARVPTARMDSPVGPLPGASDGSEAPAENPFANDGRALQEGRRFFVAYNCAGCHGDHGGGGMGPSLRDERWLYGSSDADVADSIAEGRAHGMPSWQRMLTEAQIWQIAAYVKSMRTSHEPDPPLSQ
jgi:cytochrome c oxidase cbb3-type subunit 3